MEITLLLKEPPGGRCTLYRAYAEALAEKTAAHCVETLDEVPGQAQLSAPAMLIDGKVVEPADGVIIAPDDIGAMLEPLVDDVAPLEASLEEVLERCMAEWQ